MKQLILVIVLTYLLTTLCNFAADWLVKPEHLQAYPRLDGFLKMTGAIGLGKDRIIAFLRGAAKVLKGAEDAALKQVTGGKVDSSGPPPAP
jgi:hypothetical protein